MKHRFTHYILFTVFFSAIFYLRGFAEGTLELMPTETNITRILVTKTALRDTFAVEGGNPDYRLCIHIMDPSKETIYFGLGATNGGSTVNWRIHAPDGSQAWPTLPTITKTPTSGQAGFINSYIEATHGPNILDPSGYDANSLVPTMAGDYYMTFELSNNQTRDFTYFDITVVSNDGGVNTAKLGRVFSKCWQIRNPQYASGWYTFEAQMFIYSNDGIVTKLNSNNFEGRDFSFSSNESGCFKVDATHNTQQARRSQTIQHNYPQYKVFLNNPGVNDFAYGDYPDGVIGQLVVGSTTPTPDCNGTITFFFQTTPVNAMGTSEITLQLSAIDPQPIPPYKDRVLQDNLLAGGNHQVIWDGKDANGVQIPSGSYFPFTIRYTNGLTHLPLWDVEKNIHGFKVSLVRPVQVPALDDPAFYWDDSNISTLNGTVWVDPPGCTSPTGCHGWGDNNWEAPYNGNDWGNERTINTWWYLVSNSTVPETIQYKKNPAILVPDNTPPNNPIDLCQGATATFAVISDPGSTQYYWTWPGGNQTTTLPYVTITFPVNAPPGASTVSVKGQNSECPDGPVLDIPFTMHALPDANIAGPSPVCLMSSHTYTTTATMINYNWTVTGGNISGGGTSTSSSVTVDWNVAGTGTITVSFTDPFGCGVATPGTKNITINALPVPTIAQVSPSACVNIPVIYSTEAGKTGYTWTTSPDGITSPTANPNEISITWPTSGPKAITVTYTDADGCSPQAPISVPFTVNSLPTPSFTSGENSVCFGVPGKIYTTLAGMSAYSWSITGGIITAGGTTTSNSATVTWNTLGSQSISVNYTDPATLCTAVAPTQLDVTVKPLPTPTINGPSTACVNTPGPQYFTESGKSNYIWTVNGGTFTPGTSPDIIDVVWTSTGNKSISVDYTDINGCNAATPKVINVQVTTLPNPTVSGYQPSICTGIPDNYSTEAGMQGYVWIVSAGGVINSGQGTKDLNVTWTTPGLKTVSINYGLGTGCMALNPTTINVTVNQSTPPTIQSSVNPVCETFTSVYTTQASMSAYTWTISPGGTITAGGLPTNNTVTVRWNSSTSQYVRVNFTNTTGCIAPAPTEYPVTVNPLPVATITGPTVVCQDFPTLYQYQTSVIEPAPATYSWQITSGSGNVTTSLTSNPINVNWNGPGPATIVVNAISGLGCPNSGSYNITVNAKPTVSMVSCIDPVTTQGARKFLLKGGSPFYPLMGEYIVTPTPPANTLTSDAGGNWYFDPLYALVTTYTLSYRYTNLNGCPNSVGNVQLTVQPANNTCGATMKDPRDQKTYNTALLAGKCWMTENLAYIQQNNPISVNTPQSDNCIIEKYCPDATCGHGGYYQWDELVQYKNTDAPYQGLCPPAWHVPTESEWQNLIDFFDPNFPAPSSNGLTGADLKDPGKSFKASLDGINYLNNGTWVFGTGAMTATMFWTSTTDGAGRAVARGLNNPFNPSISKYPSSPANAFPVRCIKD